MSTSSDFLNYCSQRLDADLGAISEGIINKALSKKNLNDSSGISDVEEFIDIIEFSIGVIIGKKNAITLCKSLREKAMEFSNVNETVELRDSFSIEAKDININEFLAKIHAPEISRDIIQREIIQKEIINSETKQKEITENEIQSGLPIHGDIDEFLVKKVLPAETEIGNHTSVLSKKYGLDAEKVRKEIILKVRVGIRNEIDKKFIKAEINKFLFRFPIPVKEDVDDFVNYIKISKLDCSEAGLREQIENERLYRKFQDPISAEIPSDIDTFINMIKSYNNKNDIVKALEEKELGYIIKDETGVSDKLLFNLVEHIMQIEKDSLGGLYLKQMVKKTYL